MRLVYGRGEISASLEDESLRLRRALWALLAVSALSLVIFGLLIATMLASGVLDLDPEDDTEPPAGGRVAPTSEDPA